MRWGRKPGFIHIAILGGAVAFLGLGLVFYGDAKRGAIEKPTGQISISPAGGCITPQLPIITDEAAFAQAINDYIKNKRSDSPLIGLGADFVKAGKDSGVNPAWVVSIAGMESSYGVSNLAKGPAKNSFGRRAAAGQPNHNGWYKYDSYQQSIYDQSAYLKRRYFDQGHTTFEEITNIYAPPSENDTQKYISTINKLVTEVISAAGSSVQCYSAVAVGGSNSVVAIAHQQLGLKEDPRGSNRGPDIKKFLGSSSGEPWCADFVSWVYREAGKPFRGDFDGWRIAGAVRTSQYLKQRGTWIDRSRGVGSPPLPGDVLLTRSGETQYHVGIIVEVREQNSITTISGNSSDMVKKTTFNNYLSNRVVQGWGRL